MKEVAKTCEAVEAMEGSICCGAAVKLVYDAPHGIYGAYMADSEREVCSKCGRELQ